MFLDRMMIFLAKIPVKSKPFFIISLKWLLNGFPIQKMLKTRYDVWRNWNHDMPSYQMFNITNTHIIRRAYTMPFIFVNNNFMLAFNRQIIMSLREKAGNQQFSFWNYDLLILVHTLYVGTRLWTICVLNHEYTQFKPAFFEFAAGRGASQNYSHIRTYGRERKPSP